MTNTNFKGYKSVKTKLLLSFVIVIILLLLSNVVFIVMHFTFIKQYEDVTKRLITESRFSVLVPSLVDSYLSAINGASKSRYDKYYAERAEIFESIEVLDSKIVKPESKVAYHSLKKFVSNMVDICDNGLKYSLDDNSAESFSIYQKDIVPMKPYIVESTSRLMVSELDYAQELYDNIRKTQELIVILSIVLLVLIVNLTIFFVIRISNKIAVPLTRLSNLAKDISSGNLNRSVDSDLLAFNDEIGSLSNSINEMLKKLNDEQIALASKNRKDHKKKS